jgi:hypothetical protein
VVRCQIIENDPDDLLQAIPKIRNGYVRLSAIADTLHMNYALLRRLAADNGFKAEGVKHRGFIVPALSPDRAKQLIKLARAKGVSNPVHPEVALPRPPPAKMNAYTHRIVGSSASFIEVRILTFNEAVQLGHRAHLEQTKIYPLNGKAGATPMKFPDASGVPVNMLPISDGGAFDQLKLLVDREGGTTSPVPTGSVCWPLSASSRASPSPLMRTLGRSSIRPLRPPTRRAAPSASKKSSAVSPIGSIQTVTGRCSEYVLDEHRWGISGTRRPDQLLHQLLLDQPRHVFSYTPGKGANYF